MGMFGNGSSIVIGVIILLAGFLLWLGLIQWILDVMAILFFIVGTIVVIVGLVGLVTGKKGGAGGF